MIRDITLGQYFPGKTVIHNLDPRTKLIFTLIFIVAIFLCESFISYGILLVFLMVSILISKIKPKVILRGLRPLFVIISMTAILNLFYTPGRELVSFWVFKLTVEGIINSIYMMLRIIMLVTGTFLMTYTTSPLQLTEAIECLLGPLKKIKVPVHELAMMMSIALRFIPTLIEETDKIMSAQKARGADFDTGNLFQKAKAMLPLFIPLFISAFRRADELAMAMESRCYHGGEGRTKLKQLLYRSRDYYALIFSFVLLCTVIILKVFGL